jgi:hypothetical protein
MHPNIRDVWLDVFNHVSNAKNGKLRSSRFYFYFHTHRLRKSYSMCKLSVKKCTDCKMCQGPWA